MSDRDIERMNYLESDAEVAEAAASAIAYIFEGESINAPYDLRGLCVFGVIGALRENDEAFAGLDDNQKQRLIQVETVVDKAVEARMHYYPFGHNADKIEIEYGKSGDRDDRQRANTPKSSYVLNLRGNRPGRGH